jgi:hypothetical protein
VAFSAAHVVEGETNELAIFDQSTGLSFIALLSVTSIGFAEVIKLKAT